MKDKETLIFIGVIRGILLFTVFTLWMIELSTIYHPILAAVPVIVLTALCVIIPCLTDKTKENKED